VVGLGAGDVLLGYTDGVSEAFGPDGSEQFGIDRLERVLQEVAGRGPAGVIEAIDRDLKRWTGDAPALDDITLLVISTTGAPLPIGGAGLRALAEARRSGRCLPLSVDLDSLARIGPWLREHETLSDLGRRDLEVLSSALYEACANIVEHGYSSDGGGGGQACTLELWWVPDPSEREGFFLIRDHGRPFSGSDRKPVNLADPQARRRGRGLGLEIIRRAMGHVRYFPGTPEGNITIYEFLPSPVSEQELRDA
jgi:anti-sigma regulatory factor (Ser/Thr protein kinase)